MPTASRTAGPRQSHQSEENVFVCVFHADLQKWWPEHTYSTTPDKILAFVKDRYGFIMSAHFMTTQRMAFDRLPISKRSLDEARSWIRAGCTPVHDLRDREWFTEHLIKHLVLLRPTTVVFIAHAGVDFQTLDELRKNGIKVVLLSLGSNNPLTSHADEVLNLRDIAAGKIPGRAVPGTDCGAQDWYRMPRLPKAPDEDILPRLEWQDSNLHAQVTRLLFLNGASRRSFARGLRYQFRLGLLPDVILALLFILDDAPDAEDSSIAVDRFGLLQKLRAHDVPKPEDTATQALRMLSETGDLLKDERDKGPVFFYARTADNWPAHAFAKKVCRSFKYMRAERTEHEPDRQSAPELTVKGKSFLDACIAALEIYCFNPKGLTEESHGYLQALAEIRAFKAKGSNDTFNPYGPYGVTKREDIAAFERRVSELLEQIPQERCPSHQANPHLKNAS